jgi:hypothetical protein
MKPKDEVGLLVSDMGTGRKSYIYATILDLYGPEDRPIASIDLGGERLSVAVTQLVPWAGVPDEMKETYLVTGPQRPKLGDTLPRTVEDWSHMYWVTRRLRDRFRNALSEIRWTDASLDDEASPEAMVEFLQQKIRDIKALAAEALEGKG